MQTIRKATVMTANKKKQSKVQKSTQKPMRVVDEGDPVWSAVDNLTVGLSPQERSRVLIDFVNSLPLKSPSKQEEVEIKTFDLQNLPFDPVEMAMKESARIIEKTNSNVETEQDGYYAEALRREKVRRLGKNLNTPSEETYDPIEEAMQRYPKLTREKAIEMAKAFGFL